MTDFNWYAKELGRTGFGAVMTIMGALMLDTGDRGNQVLVALANILILAGILIGFSTIISLKSNQDKLVTRISDLEKNTGFQDYGENPDMNNLEKNMHRGKKTKINWLIVITILGTLVLAGLSWILIDLNNSSLQESETASKLLVSINRTNNLLVANLYSNFDLELKYDVYPFFRYESGGLPNNVIITNYGDFNVKINTKSYLIEYCAKNGTAVYTDRIKSISNSVQESKIIERKNSDYYDMQIMENYKNYTNLKPFIMEMVSEGNPVTADNTPIEYFTKTKITRIQFNYDNQSKNWVPQLGWESLNCNNHENEQPPLKLDTKNNTQFKPI